MRYLIRATAACLLMVAPFASAVTINAAAPTTTGGTFIDFEGQSNGANADNLYSGLGVTFSTASGNSRIWNPTFAGNQVASSGTGVLGPSSANDDPLSMTFSSLQQSVEFFFADPNVFAGTSYTISAFGLGNVLLESLLIPASSLPGTIYTGFVRGGNDIASISIDPSNGGENFNIDDLRFSAAPVPAPAGVLLLGLGLLALRKSRRA